MRLDAHHSFSQRYPLATLASILKRNRFDGSVLVADAPDFAGLPEFVRAIVIQSDRVESRLLDEYRQDPRFRGLGLRAAEGTLETLGELERRNLTLDLWDGLACVPRFAERFPALRIAIVHLGSPVPDRAGDWDRWAGAMEAAARLPQVSCKLSGLAGLSAGGAWSAEELRPYVRHALAVFGADRLMFGSGWPASLPEHTWKESLAAFTQSIGAQPIEVREQLLGGTAARFYGIGQ